MSSTFLNKSASKSKSPYEVVVIGAGVQGLSIAQELTNRGYRVAIIARDLPEDLHSAAFASPWAGADWAPFAVTPAERARDTFTFHKFGDLSKQYPGLVSPARWNIYWKDENHTGDDWHKDLVPDFQLLDRSEIPKHLNYGQSYTSYKINTPLYLAHLANTLRSAGVPIIRHRLSSLDEAYSILGPVDLVVNATALGSRTLLGVQDSKVFPARGQTVLVRAPRVKEGYSLKEPLRTDGQRTYIIPRPGVEDHVILGGTFIKDDWDTQPRPETAERILKDAFAICPELSQTDSWEGIEVISHNVGLRPCREGGLRLELEERTVGEGKAGLLGPERGKIGKGRKVAVLHAYGIGPAGYQSSLGVADEAAGKVDEWFTARGISRL
ncbi:hypothetical protein BCR39DRAFT_144032 [Naematelia encephala]|uniref:FAD dependent oxidoreductase domain-containing protein n=1 Tax=Naematelia encephala TaxID=71784 RepID=A0A1Y2BK88_9TREE|nr:hypothetical protein BCR39DRAFT_144032 [Naematelia encephala]